jgi:hypothetical protein
MPGTSLFNAPFLSNLGSFILHVSHMRDDGMWRVSFNDSPRADGTPAHQVSRYITYQGTVVDGPLVLFLAREYKDGRCAWLYGRNLDNLESRSRVFAENWNSPFEVGAGADLLRRAHGHVQVGGGVPEAVGRRLQAPARVQHGRVAAGHAQGRREAAPAHDHEIWRSVTASSAISTTRGS